MLPFAALCGSPPPPAPTVGLGFHGMNTRAETIPTTQPLRSLIRALRPHQWIKNCVVFAALIFAKRFTDPASVLDAALTFGLFCLICSAVYLINDLLDVQADRCHPVKSLRPIAAGEVSVATAISVAVVVIAGCSPPLPSNGPEAPNRASPRATF